MSSRQIRRLMAEREQRQRELKTEEEEEEEKVNEEPAATFSPYVVHTNLAFDGLEVSSSSECELSVQSGHQDELDVPDEDKYGAKKKTSSNTKNNKKKKRKNVKKSNEKADELDEVEWSLKEVNRMLGSPPEKAEDSTVDKMAQLEKTILLVNYNHIDVNYELAREGGLEEKRKKVRNDPRRVRHEIGLSPTVHPFKVKGLTMSRFRVEGDIKYFKFEHSQAYTARCHSLVQHLKQVLVGEVRRDNNLYSEVCVEALLENCEFLYYIEEHIGANQALEQAIYFMQSVGEHTFNFVDGKTRLEYKFVENRPFHIAVLKYMHVLSNTACYRTALELGKLLLNLDPSDPLAVIFIIDTLAIRAREYQWLLDLIEYWRETRQANSLFHMRYSRALAMFQLARKNKDYDGIESASRVLTKAIKYFPPVAAMMMEFTKMRIPDEIKKHEIFIQPKNIFESKELAELMALYAWMIVPSWREPKVWKWFMDTVAELIEEYNQSPTIQEQVKLNARLRAQLYRKLPTELKRHLHAIKPMANYISEGRMPHIKPSVSFNPFPDEGSSVDFHNYFIDWAQQYGPQQNTLRAFIESISP